MQQAATAAQLSTRRLVLQPIDASYASALFAHFNDWEVIRWLSAPPWPFALDDMERWMESAAKANADGRDLDRIIALDGLPIGAIGATGLTTGPVLGFWLARPFWGHGFMSEAAQRFIENLFEMGHFFVSSGAISGNLASLRIQEKLGFRVVNERFIHARPHGGLVPHIDTVLGRERWSHWREQRSGGVTHGPASSSLVAGDWLYSEHS